MQIHLDTKNSNFQRVGNADGPIIFGDHLEQPKHTVADSFLLFQKNGKTSMLRKVLLVCWSLGNLNFRTMLTNWYQCAKETLAYIRAVLMCLVNSRRFTHSFSDDLQPAACVRKATRLGVEWPRKWGLLRPRSRGWSEAAPRRKRGSERGTW